MINRVYDQELGLFTQVDPPIIFPAGGYLPSGDDAGVNGGLYSPININPYRYARNSPVVYNDPTGHIDEMGISQTSMHDLANTNKERSASNQLDPLKENMDAMAIKYGAPLFIELVSPIPLSPPYEWETIDFVAAGVEAVPVVGKIGGKAIKKLKILSSITKPTGKTLRAGITASRKTFESAFNKGLSLITGKRKKITK